MSAYLSDYFSKLGNAASKEAFEVHSRRYAFNYDSLLKDIPKDSEVLDIGCGVGQFLYYLNKSGYHNITGIDYDQDMITVAKQMVPDARCISMPVKEYLDNCDCKYALVVMNDVNEHLQREDVIPILEMIRKVIRTNGYLILKTPNMASPLGPNLRYKDFTHCLGFTESSLEQVMLAAGFESIESFEEEAPVTSWRADLRKRIFLRGALKIWRMFYFCLEGLPAPKVLTQWVIMRGTARGDSRSQA